MYMRILHQNCYDTPTEECSKNTHKTLSLDFDRTKKCVEDSFSSSDWGASTTNNTIIDAEINYWKKYGSGIYPAIVINNKTYRGQLESLAVFNGICAGFANPPALCAATLGANTPDFLPGDQVDGIKGGVIVAIVFGLIFLNMIIVYCYRRYSRREMQSEM
jgi:hypothetical protein